MHIFLNSLLSTLNTTIFSIFLCAVFFTPPISAMGAMPGLENLSPEDMQLLEQTIQEEAQKMEAYVNSLSPQEREEFQKAVQEVETMMSSMNEEELSQFFEQIIAAEMEQAQLQGIQPLPLQQPPVTFEQKPVPVVSKVPLTSAEEKALALLTSLIDTTDKLLVKTDNIPEIQRMFEQWAKKNKISGASPETRWPQQKNNIIELRQHASDLKKTDLKTGKYLFIEAFIKNTSLYSQLETLVKQLETNEPRVVVSNFGIEKLSDSAKLALQTCLSAYGASLQSSKTDIKKLFDEIGPELAKIKEEEKKITEKAQADASKTRQVLPGRTAGADKGFGGYYAGGNNGYDNYDHDRSRYVPDSGYGINAKPGTQTDNKDQNKKTPGSGKGKNSDKEAQFKDKKAASKETEKKDAKLAKDAQKVDALVSCPADGGEQLNGKYELIASNYRYITELLKENSGALEFNKLTMTEKVDPQYALYVFPTVERRLKRLNELVNEYIKQAQASKDMEQKNAALEKLVTLHSSQERLNELTEKLEVLLAPLSDSSDSTKADAYIREMNPNVRYAYFKDSLQLKSPFKDEKLKNPSEAIKKQLPETGLVSLSDILAQLKKLNAAMPQKVSSKKDSLDLNNSKESEQGEAQEQA